MVHNSVSLQQTLIEDIEVIYKDFYIDNPYKTWNMSSFQCCILLEPLKSLAAKQPRSNHLHGAHLRVASHAYKANQCVWICLDLCVASLQRNEAKDLFSVSAIVLSLHEGPVGSPLKTRAMAAMTKARWRLRASYQEVLSQLCTFPEISSDLFPSSRNNFVWKCLKRKPENFHMQTSPRPKLMRYSPQVLRACSLVDLTAAEIPC